MPLPRRPYVTTRAHEVFERAHALAERLGHDGVTPVHVALGLVHRGPGVVDAILSQTAPLNVLERELETCLPPPGSPRAPAREPSWTPGIEQMVERATAESRDLGVEFQGPEHLLLALLRDQEGAPARALARHGVGFADVRAVVLRMYAARPGG